MKVPVVELSECTRCEICVSVCPDVFGMNASGFIQVAAMEEYPEAGVNEAIKNCPADCICWEDS